MTQEYALDDMVKAVSAYFRRKGFHPEPYERSYNVRLPLYCEKTAKGKESSDETDKIVVDIITEPNINIDAYMPDFKHFGKFVVRNASSVKFFQYYIPESKVYWAYARYVDELSEEFKKFRECCSENGIGLLRVSDKRVRTVLEALSLQDILRKRVEKSISSATTDVVNAVSTIISDHEKEYIQHLVFYGEPRFLRRAITVREEDLGLFLSMSLMNQLENLKNIAYGQRLKDFVRDYRYESEDDHQIASKVMRELWKNRFGVEYPDMLKEFEVVLLLDPDYRDHFLHQFQVFIMGALIIDILYKEAWVKDFENEYKSKIEDAWLACSTYHDYNYPVQKWDRWMNSFLEKNFHVNKSTGKYHLEQKDIAKEIIRLNIGDLVVRSEFLAKMQRLTAGFNCDYNDSLLRFVLQRVTVDKNHAVIGALTFLEKLQSCENLTEKAINASAAAILLHDEPNWQCFRGDTKALITCSYGKSELCVEEHDLCGEPILDKLTLNSMPLAFLLSYCDVAQEWGRQGARFKVVEPKLEDIQMDTNKIMVHISVADDESYEPKEQEITRLGRFLKDERFEMKVSSRKSQRSSTIPMKGD